MSIALQGFLSPELSAWTAKHRSENPRWFELAEALNRIGCSLQRGLTIPADDNHMFLAALLFMRGLSSFQASVLLAERGMTTEARTLARSCFESVFCLGAVCTDPAFPDRFIRDDSERRQKLARALLKLPPESSGLEAEHEAKLRNFLASQAESGIDPAPLVIADAAVRAGMTGVYDMFYRGLSNDAAHPSVTALNRHVEANENGVVVGLRAGPDVSDVKDTLAATCTAAIYMVNCLREKIADQAHGQEFGAAWELYKQLIREFEKELPTD
jgi:Family of unknown function (DUF5677)